MTGLFSDTLFDVVIELTALEDDLGSSPLFELSDTLLLSILPPVQDDTPLDYLHAFGIRQEVLQEYLSNFENARDRVNRWILHQLRLSRREVFGLQRRITTAAPEMNDWVDMVLDEWSSDTLGQEQSSIYGSTECGSLINAAHHVSSPHLNNS